MWPTGVQALERPFYARPAPLVARQLLNKIIERDGLAARIVETEAYGGADDAASHGYRRRTNRNAVMFGPAGCLYVYFTYGMHYCACPVTGDEGESSAVLIRACEPLAGLEQMRLRRPNAKTDRDLLNGPAKFAQAFDLMTVNDGLDLCGDSMRIVSDGTAPPARPVSTTRVGLNKGTEKRWRWHVRNNAFVSPGRPS